MCSIDTVSEQLRLNRQYYHQNNDNNANGFREKEIERNKECVHKAYHEKLEVWEYMKQND